MLDNHRGDVGFPFMTGGGAVRDVIAGFDWGATPLGPISSWRQTLKTTLGLILNSPVPIVTLWGEDGVMIYNDAYSVFAGGRHPALLGSKVREGWPEVAEFNDNVMKVGLAGGTLAYQDQELTLYRNGEAEQVWMNLDYSPILDEVGRPIGVIAIVVETSAKVRAERWLRSERERLQQMFEQAPGFIAMLKGRNHVFDLTNPAYMQLIGHRPVIGKPLADALPDAVAQGYLDLLDKVFASGRAYAANGAKYAVQPVQNGPITERYIDFVYQPILDARGRTSGIFVEGFDVTERVRAERALHELNATLERRVTEAAAKLQIRETMARTFFEHSSECYAVLVEGGAGRFWYEEINPATLRLYNRTRDEAIGHWTEEVIGAQAAAEVNRHLAACLRSGAPYRYERVQGDGIVEAIATPVPAQVGVARRVVVSARDTSERRRLAEQLRQAQKMEAVGQLTGGVAHDFNNLLTLVMGGLDLIGRQLPQLQSSDAKARIERARELALQGVSRAAALTSRLLAFSRQQALNPQIVDSNKVVAEICDLLRGTLGETVSLETVIAGGLWAAFADPNQLENALLNLALNARDAMPNGGKLTIETANASLDHTYVGSLSEPVASGHYVMIAVSDTGAGMDRETLSRAFDPFFTTKEAGKGTGLGLSQVYGFARQSAGHVKIYSEIGQGTTVKVYLPRHLGAADGITFDATPALDHSVGTETILIVEDDDALRAYASDILHELGYRVLDAADGAAALQIVEKEPDLDLLLSDVIMPGGMNGRQLADEAVNRRPGLKVLFMTGYTRNAIVHHGRLDSGVHVIGKPFSFQELARRVRARLDLSE